MTNDQCHTTPRRIEYNKTISNYQLTIPSIPKLIYPPKGTNHHPYSQNIFDRIDRIPHHALRSTG